MNETFLTPRSSPLHLAINSRPIAIASKGVMNNSHGLYKSPLETEEGTIVVDLPCYQVSEIGRSNK